MINLLPAEEKQKRLSEKREKLAIIFGIVVLVALVCLALILLSVKFYILSAVDYQKSVLAQEKQQTQTQDFSDLNSVVKKYNAVLAQLDSFYKNEAYFSKALEEITGIQSPAGLYLKNFLLSRGDDGGVQVGVSGVSDTRDNLLIFQQNIEQNKDIKNPYFSPESWINPKNANFSLTFEIYPNENKQ